jgi:hypothetical protein
VEIIRAESGMVVSCGSGKREMGRSWPKDNKPQLGKRYNSWRSMCSMVTVINITLCY